MALKPRSPTQPISVQLPTRVREPGAPPPLVHRLVVASVVGILASVTTYFQQLRTPAHPRDFGIAWFGAKALLHGANPYVLVGEGRVYEWPWDVVLYPGTAMVAAIPFTLLSQWAATLLFVWISTALLAYAITADGWYRMPLFLSSAFIVAASAAQWSPLLSAALCIPSLAWLLAVKPNLGLALLASATGERTVKVAIVGGAVLLVVSLMIYPAWPTQWLHAIRSVTNMHAPVLLPGGVFVLLALLRWRRPEARLIVALACVPQTNSWYEALPLLLVPATFRESIMLSVVSTTGGAWWQVLVGRQFITGHTDEELNKITGILMIAFAYLPATLLVLNRPNEGKLPPFLDRFIRYGRRQPI